MYMPPRKVYFKVNEKKNHSFTNDMWDIFYVSIGIIVIGIKF